MTGRFYTEPAFFREATQDDETMLSRMAKRTIATCYHHFLGPHKVIEVLQKGAIDEYLADSIIEDYCPILLLDGNPVGFAICRDINIDLIVIDYQHQRLGLGTQLLAQCEAELFQVYPAIAVQCFEPNEPANRFFRKNGWTETLTYRDEKIGIGTIVYQKYYQGRPAG